MGSPDARDVPLVGGRQLSCSALGNAIQGRQRRLCQVGQQLRGSRHALGQQKQQQAAARPQPQQPTALPTLLFIPTQTLVLFNMLHKSYF